MKNLTIKDLDRSEQLDHAAMSSVRGGWSMFSPSVKTGDLTYKPSYDSSINALQNLGQEQNVGTVTANGSAFLDCVGVHSNVHQNGQNKIVG